MFALKPYDRTGHAVGYNPFREMDELERRFFSNPFGFFGGNALSEFRTDITDAGDAYLLEADLPGFNKKDIHLDVNGDMLTVRAERRSNHEEKDANNRLIRSERSYGSYSREFDLSGVDADGITAKYEDGVLKLNLPKKETTLPASRTLEIE